MKVARTRKLKLPDKPIYSAINAESAKVWNTCIVLMKTYQYQRGYPHAHHDFWFGKDCEGWIDKHLSKQTALHSQSRQKVRANYFKAWKSHAALKRNGHTDAKPPNKQKTFYTTTWLKSAIRIAEKKCLKTNTPKHLLFSSDNLLGKTLTLSNGRNAPPLVIDLPKAFDTDNAEQIALIRLAWTVAGFELHFTYTDNISPPAPDSGCVGVDIGEIHPFVTYDGQHVDIYNGRYIRSLYRRRNKLLAWTSHKLSKCQKGSIQWSRYLQRKWKHLHRLDNQIQDCLHKHTAKFVEVCQKRDIGQVVIGDLIGIREQINVGKKTNQKLHQWPFARITSLLTYKCQAVGIKVTMISEKYTSQTCPSCGNRKKPANRNYKCPCGFQYHRDGVGAINIRKKYLGDTLPVVGSMALPRGYRLQVPQLALA